jgi:hypothetical protein
VRLQLIGSGNPKELFYTDSRCKQAYKNYVYMLLNRVNTYTGVQYKNDPVMFSFELMVWPSPCNAHERPCKRIFANFTDQPLRRFPMPWIGKTCN